MHEAALRTRLAELYELINQVLPTGDEPMEASPHQWRELNDLTRKIADGTQACADYWREVAARR